MRKLTDNQKLRIAAVSFLNARPITYGLERGLGGDRFELTFELPSRCAQLLAAGEVDVGLIPTAAYAESPVPLRAVPGIAIASLGPVRTVLLVSERPWDELEEITLDGASRSSAALVKVLCKERGLAPRFREVPHEAVLDAVADRTGALVIGDAGFGAAEKYPHVVDLGQAW
ncbi:MAG TPA: menaquinone biosynthesis protein, partial [Polyangia bacterium]|nr:menaquinone biosynthesis protein [Polyangia bacterium]